MNFSRKQILAAVAAVTMLPGKLWALAVQAFSRRPKPPAGDRLRAGPWLGDWRQCHWMPVGESVHPTGQRLLLAVQRHELLALRYWGGSTPGALRTISPGLVFQVGGCGPLYVSGYCHLRRQERVFRVDQVELIMKAHEPICITE